jgi:uncharacterized protein (DUF1499 family)
MAVVSRAANFAAKIGGAALLLFALGPLLAQLGWASPFVSFRVFGLGLLLGLVALLAGVLGLWQTRPGAGREGRQLALVGAGIGALLPAIVSIPLAGTGGAPMINDITTDTDDPPRFRVAQTDDANTGRDLAYPGESFAAQQRAGYPDLLPIPVSGAPDAVFARSVEVAEELGWKITMQDGASGTFEAVDVSSVFGFVDDIVVRVRGEGDETVVDVRSKSRDGKGDMGANAARIRAFRDALTG